MKRKFFSITIMLVMSLVLVLSGCSTKKESKEALQNAALNAFKMDSYVLNNQIQIKDLSLNIPEGDTQEMQSVVQMLKNAQINITQVYQKDPMQTEATFEVKLQGDVSTTISIPIIFTKEKMYVKVPSIPFYPLPESVVGKFLVLDMKELAEQEGTEFNPDMFNIDKTQKLVGEISKAAFEEYDSGKYFKDIDPKDASLPEGVEAKQVVQFFITNDNVKDAITILVNKVAPKVLDILNKEEYRKMLQLTTDDIADAKKQLSEGDQAELSKGLDDLKKFLKVNTFNVNTAINKDEFPVYQNLNGDLQFNDPDSDENIRISFEAKSTYTKINEKPEFKYGIPADALTMEQFQEAMSSVGME
ncbi:hypothetical protein DCC85_00430 [Paenibacillus sp. CAA11]|uniref:hypothetical protein n=1 Tax=Paenibacillus sp. CAA11 TaxID=1532905 RepID=UPI000D3D46EA|nr:hypothetical protein [Paenibacillus sp. CAA11]AWB42853.1 hypothetical protein DCC85_00430 [Paenibacillus sp. CAA11]